MRSIHLKIVQRRVFLQCFLGSFESFGLENILELNWYEQFIERKNRIENTNCRDMHEAK